jgi:predicted Zn-dependent protease
LRSEKENAFALELANLLRSEGQSQAALSSAERAVRMDPYRPSNRELAAAAAIEAGNLQSAMRHIEALLVLEPDQPLHVRRIDAIKRLLSKDQQDG